MLLSEAMREGAKVHKQGNGDFAVADINTGELYTCAIGAAAVGKLIEREVEYTEDIIASQAHDIYSELDSIVFRRCPSGCGESHGTLADTIATLNDQHGWTREAIAQWLAGLGY